MKQNYWRPIRLIYMLALTNTIFCSSQIGHSSEDNPQSGCIEELRRLAADTGLISDKPGDSERRAYEGATLGRWDNEDREDAISYVEDKGKEFLADLDNSFKLLSKQLPTKQQIEILDSVNVLLKNYESSSRTGSFNAAYSDFLAIDKHMATLKKVISGITPQDFEGTTLKYKKMNKLIKSLRRLRYDFKEETYSSFEATLIKLLAPPEWELKQRSFFRRFF
ncbi:MAG: hypothetical protein KA116_07080 [Proteobacteria bacterium]|nr:hypothetical protein [Pseudomonadota bacterium]